jgi:hypothetical protein
MRDKLVIAFALLSARSASAESPPDCTYRSVGSAAFRDGTSIEILRPGDAEANTFAWERTSDLGQTFDPILRAALGIDVWSERLDLHPSPVLDQLVLYHPYDVASVDAGGLQATANLQSAAVVAAEVAFDSAGLASIAYVEMTADAYGKTISLHLVRDASPGAGIWAPVTSLAGGRCFGQIPSPADASIAIVFDSTDTLWVGCNGERGASVYRLEGNELAEVAQLASRRMAKIAAAVEPAGPSIFLLDFDGEVHSAGIVGDWQLQPVGRVEGGVTSQDKLFAADSRTWIHKGVGGGIVQVGIDTAGTWNVEAVPTFVGSDRIFDVAAAPLRILWGDEQLFVSERASGWTDPVVVADGLRLEAEYVDCGGGSDSGGCSAAPAGSRPWSWLLVIGAVISLRLPRRSRRLPPTSG